MGVTPRMSQRQEGTGKIELLKQVLAANGKPNVVIPKLRNLLEGVIPMDALDQLESEPERIVLEAYYLSRMSMREISDMIGYSIRQAYRLRTAGLQKLAHIANLNIFLNRSKLGVKSELL